jgi:hypothetical protein
MSPAEKPIAWTASSQPAATSLPFKKTLAPELVLTMPPMDATRSATPAMSAPIPRRPSRRDTTPSFPASWWRLALRKATAAITVAPIRIDVPPAFMPIPAVNPPGACSAE